MNFCKEYLFKKPNGQQINHPIGLKILGMIKLTINFSLVKKISKYLCLKIWIFPNIFIESSSSKEDKYGLKMTTTIEPP